MAANLELEQADGQSSISSVGFVRRCILAWPRTFLLIVGVVVPLWSLVGISVLFGRELARREAPSEIEANDASLAAYLATKRTSNRVEDFSADIPRICYELYWKNDTETHLSIQIEQAYRQADAERQANKKIEIINDETFIEDIVDGDGKSVEDLVNQKGLVDVSDSSETETAATEASTASIVLNHTMMSSSVLIDAVQMFQYMSQCGEAGKSVAAALLERAMSAADQTPGTLSFNWIRCMPTSHGLLNPTSVVSDIEDVKPQKQEIHYFETWDRHRLQLIEMYINDRIAKGLTPDGARGRAMLDATGESGCELNSAAGAWFWFTVTSTVGYGNQAPGSSVGRAMVYILGFFSILIFGGLLAEAGYIVARIFDDAVARHQLVQLRGPWAQSLLWGASYYGWMLLIALETKRWKMERLNEEYSFRDVYWFSYISTTTVGLGDIFLEPAVILTRDLISFPLMFLIGFTFFSAFVAKFSEAIWNLFASSKLLFVMDVLNQLQESEVSTDNDESSSSLPSETDCLDTVKGAQRDNTMVECALPATSAGGIDELKEKAATSQLSTTELSVDDFKKKEVQKYLSSTEIDLDVYEEDEASRA